MLMTNAAACHGDITSLPDSSKPKVAKSAAESTFHHDDLAEHSRLADGVPGTATA